MAILYGGAVYYKSDIVFSDNTFDMKSAHPVMVLFSTDEYDENAYVLPMTSDRNRARNNRELYTPIVYNKKSFLNLSQIIKIPNTIRKNCEYISIAEYERVLKDFYKYQSNNKNDSNFNEIKDRIEIILKMLESAKGNDRIKEFLVNNTNLQKYLINNKDMTTKTKEEAINAIVQMNSKEKIVSANGRNFKEVALAEFDQFNTYIQQNPYLENPDFINNVSGKYNKFKEYFAKLQSKYPMINAEQLILAEVAMLYRDDTSVMKIAKLKNIEKFIGEEIKNKKEEIEKKIARENEKKLSKIKKSEEKTLKRKEENEKRIASKRKKNKKRLEEKYGKFREF